MLLFIEDEDSQEKLAVKLLRTDCIDLPPACLRSAYTVGKDTAMIARLVCSIPHHSIVVTVSTDSSAFIHHLSDLETYGLYRSLHHMVG